MVFCLSDVAIGELNIPLLTRMCRVVAYPFGVLIGFLFGLYFALTSGVYASIIPGGQEAEYTAVGMCVCSGNLFVYLGADVVGYVLVMVVEKSCNHLPFHSFPDCENAQVVYHPVSVVTGGNLWRDGRPLSHSKSPMGFPTHE